MRLYFEAGRSLPAFDQAVPSGRMRLRAHRLRGRGSRVPMGDIIAHVLWQNLRAALHVGVLIPNEPPKVREAMTLCRNVR